MNQQEKQRGLAKELLAFFSKVKIYDENGKCVLKKEWM